MMVAAAHRGPDGATTWVAPDGALAELTLDVWSHPRRTPWRLENGGLVIAADARVDNRDDLIAELAAANELSPSDDPTDSELILGAYRTWGEDAPAALLGDFAFVIWDAGRRTLFAARDTGGNRPLYVCREGSRVYLASEVKQILAVRRRPPRINESMLGAYLAACGGRPEWSFYEGIEHVPKAHAVIASRQRFRMRRYWEIHSELSIDHRNEDDYAEELRWLLGEAVRARMDVATPVGIWLSGGLDSGSVASMAGHLLESGATGAVRAFSYAFEELSESDERWVSRHIVERYGLASTDIPADDAWPLCDAPLHGPDKDEPLMGAYQVLHERVYEAAKQHGIGVMFTGASGDNFAGGEIFDYPHELRRDPRRAWRHLRDHATFTGESLRHVLLQRVAWPMVAPHLPTGAVSRLRVARSTGHEWPSWIRDDFASRVALDEITRLRVPGPSFPHHGAAQRYQALMDPISMRGTVWDERNHARWGFGYADPWSDRRLAEFSLAVPQWLFNRGAVRKNLVRRAMTGIMPEDARTTARKICLSPLYRRGIDEHERARVVSLVRSSRLAAMGVVDADALLTAIESGDSGGAEWPTLSTELWLRGYWE